MDRRTVRSDNGPRGVQAFARLAFEKGTDDGRWDGFMTQSELALAGHDVEEARANLERLFARALHWSSHNVAYLDPADTELPALPKLKARTELALLSRLWTRLRPQDEDLGPVTALVHKLWQDPDTPRPAETAPAKYRQFVLTYAALAPAGVPTEFHRTPLAEIAPGGYLAPYGKSPYLRLEARYYAELAGLRHGFESYQDLYQASILGNLRSVPLPMDIEDAYKVTHTLFLMTDFASRDHGLTDRERKRAFGIVDEMTDHFIEVEHWDLTAEMVLSQFCLGEDPTRTRSGAAGIRTLLDAQTPSGAIPGRYAAQRAPESATAVEFFRKSFHTTLVAAIASMVILSSPQSS